jgi:hypothetical protein
MAAAQSGRKFGFRRCQASRRGALEGTPRQIARLTGVKGERSPDLERECRVASATRSLGTSRAIMTSSPPPAYGDSRESIRPLVVSIQAEAHTKLAVGAGIGEQPRLY